MGMTKGEREELVFKLAKDRVSKLNHAGMFAMAVDQMYDLLMLETDEQLLKVSLGYAPKKRKRKV